MNSIFPTSSGAALMPHTVNTPRESPPALAPRQVFDVFDWLNDAREEIAALNSISGKHSRCSALLGKHPHDATARLLQEPAARAQAILPPLRVERGTWKSTEGTR